MNWICSKTSRQRTKLISCWPRCLSMANFAKKPRVSTQVFSTSMWILLCCRYKDIRQRVRHSLRHSLASFLIINHAQQHHVDNLIRILFCVLALCRLSCRIRLLDGLSQPRTIQRASFRLIDVHTTPVVILSIESVGSFASPSCDRRVFFACFGATFSILGMSMLVWWFSRMSLCRISVACSVLWLVAEMWLPVECICP